jgi:hypothetical protein
MLSRTEPSNIMELAVVNDLVFMFNKIDWPSQYNIIKPDMHILQQRKKVKGCMDDACYPITFLGLRINLIAQRFQPCIPIYTKPGH